MNDTNDMVASEQATQILTKKEHGDRMAGWLDKLAPTIERALSKAMDTPAFVTTCLTAFKTTPKLMDCHPTSFLAVVMQCAQLKLPPDPTLGWAWIIPRRGVATFQLGYRGAIALAYRSGQVRAVRAGVVREGDEWEFVDGWDPVLRHRRLAPQSADRLHSWSVIETMNGGKIPWVLDADAVAKIKSAHVMSGSGPWTGKVQGKDDPGAEDAMWMKAAIVRGLKLAPLEVEIQRAISLDETADAGLDQPISVLAGANAIDVEDIVAESTEVVEDGGSQSAAFDSEHGEADQQTVEVAIQAIAGKLGLDADELDEISNKVVGGPVEGVPEEMGLKLLGALAVYEANDGVLPEDWEDRLAESEGKRMEDEVDDLGI